MMNTMSVRYLQHHEIGCVVAQHDKTGMHCPIAKMYEDWKSGVDTQSPVRDENMLKQLVAALKLDGKFREAPKLTGAPGVEPGVEDGRTRLFAAYEHSMTEPDFTLEVTIP